MTKSVTNYKWNNPCNWKKINIEVHFDDYEKDDFDNEVRRDNINDIESNEKNVGGVYYDDEDYGDNDDVNNIGN